MTTLIVILRVIHIVGSVYWVGAACMVAAFVMPSAKAIGPEGGKFVQHMVGVGRFSLSMYVASLAASISGLILYGVVHGFRLGMLQSGFGLGITVGAAVGVLALLHGSTVQGRIASQMEALGKEVQRSGQPPSAEQQARLQELEARFTKGEHAGVAMLLISTIAMAVARYL